MKIIYLELFILLNLNEVYLCLFICLDNILKIVVLPLLSSPIMIIFIYFLPDSFENIFVKNPPIFYSIILFKNIFYKLYKRIDLYV